MSNPIQNLILKKKIKSYFLFFRSSKNTEPQLEAVVVDSTKIVSDLKQVEKSNIKKNDPIKATETVVKPIEEKPKVIEEQPKVSVEKIESKVATRSFEAQPKASAGTGTLQITSDSDCIVYVDGNSYGRIKASQTKNISLKATEGSHSYRNYIILVAMRNY